MLMAEELALIAMNPRKRKPSTEPGHWLANGALTAPG